MKLFKNKFVVSVILLCLAAVFAFVLLPMLYNQQNERITIVKLKNDVGAGTRITSDMVSTVETTRLGLESDVITDANSVIDKYAAVNISHKDALYPEKFSESFSTVSGAGNLLLSDSDKIISLSLTSAASGVAGEIWAGATVDAIIEMDVYAAAGAGYVKLVDTSGVQIVDLEGNSATGSGEGEAAATTPSVVVISDRVVYLKDNFIDGTYEQTVMVLEPMLTGVRVYDVYNSSLVSLSEVRQQISDGSVSEADADLIPTFVSLIVDDEQAVELATQEYGGQVHLVRHAGGASA